MKCEFVSACISDVTRRNFLQIRFYGDNIVTRKEIGYLADSEFTYTSYKKYFLA
jgi:hypothetical protein